MQIVMSTIGYQVFRITLIVREYHKDCRIYWLVNCRIVQNYGSVRIYRWGSYHLWAALTEAPNQYSSKVHAFFLIGRVFVLKRIRCVSGEVSTPSKRNSSCKKKVIPLVTINDITNLNTDPVGDCRYRIEKTSKGNLTIIGLGLSDHGSQSWPRAHQPTTLGNAEFDLV